MTTVVTTLLDRNERYAAQRHAELPFLPRLNLCVVACPDPRSDPAIVLGLEPGDAAVVRAAAGRISPIVQQQLLFLAAAGAAAGQAAGVAAGQAAGVAAGQAATGLELILMTHTDCAITRLSARHRPALATFLGCGEDELDGKAVNDPYAAVSVDIDALAANPLIPAELAVTGLVFDVHTGRTKLVERRAPLRP